MKNGRPRTALNTPNPTTSNTVAAATANRLAAIDQVRFTAPETSASATNTKKGTARVKMSSLAEYSSMRSGRPARRSSRSQSAKLRGPSRSSMGASARAPRPELPPVTTGVADQLSNAFFRARHAVRSTVIRADRLSFAGTRCQGAGTELVRNTISSTAST